MPMGVGMRHPIDINPLDCAELAAPDQPMEGTKAIQLGIFEIDHCRARRRKPRQSFSRPGAARQRFFGENCETTVKGERRRPLGELGRQRQCDCVEILGKQLFDPAAGHGDPELPGDLHCLVPPRAGDSGDGDAGHRLQGRKMYRSAEAGSRNADAKLSRQMDQSVTTWKRGNGMMIFERSPFWRKLRMIGAA